MAAIRVTRRMWASVGLALVCGVGAPASLGAQPERARPGVYLTLLAQTRIEPEHATLGRIGGISGGAFAPDVGADGTREALLVSDVKQGLSVYRMAVGLERSETSGRWTLSLDLAETIDLAHPAIDAEAMAYGPDRDEVFISYERPPTIARVSLDDRGEAETLAIPEPIRVHHRPNQGLECLAYRSAAVGGEVWSAMQGPLTIDGAEATAERGALCRVLVHDAESGELERELFYETAPAPRGIRGGPRFNSLADMAALPDGRLLIMERGFAAPRGYDARIYVVDADATVDDDPEREFPTLAKTLVAAVAKTGVMEQGNLEAMLVGPSIAELTGDAAQDGRLLLLIADDNFGADGQRSTQALAYRMMVEE